jgi:secreted protein with Ig-like and vWFA domain
MTFSSPWSLLLLLFFPLFVWLGWPSRGPSRRREIVSLALRLLITLLLVLGLAGLEIRRQAEELSVVFLVDNSDSMSVPVTVNGIAATPRQLAQAYVREALKELGPDDRAGVIVFGGDAVVERPLSDSPELASFTSRVTTLQTDLAEAIRLGMALLPADTARRIVILSDGLETTGDAYEAARLAAASGVQLHVVPFRVQGGAEALVTSVEAPATLREGEQFGLEVTIDSALDQTMGVRVLAGEAVAYEGTLDLNRGVNHYTLSLVAGPPGFASYRVQLLPLDGGDTFYQNNELAAFSQIVGPPKVLLVRNPNPRDGVDETKELSAALEAASVLIDRVTPSGLPSDLAALSEYASVILVDVPARELAPRQMTALQTYVRDLGGGLVVVGGPSSYGVGGYFKTPLEETLPVEMQLKDQQRRPQLTMVFIIDKSGSMSETSGGATKVELAKEAIIRSIELLSPLDKVGVIAFDDAAKWVAPITPLDDPNSIINAVGTIRADGGTDIFAGVTAASLVLPGDEAAVKHIILLTDGGADPTGIAELVTEMNLNYGITLSSVGVGRDAAPFLPELAAAGGGLYHFTDDPSTIAAIFTEETTLATRAYLIEEEFFPEQVNPSPILAGIQSVPSLLGYVGATAKDAAQTILISAQKDPVLAVWQYGLGKAVAWTSDATGRWARNWVSWDQYARFWAQVVRYTLNEGAQSNSEVRVARSGELATITVDAQSDAGAYLNSLTLLANVVAPDGRTQTVTLQQVAPGRYEGAFQPAVEGAYLIRVAGTDTAQTGGADPVAQTAGWVLSYSPEYQTLSGDVNFLARLAALTGGRALGSEFEAIFQHDLAAPARAARPAWPGLLTLAAFLLPLDIAIRRLVLTRYEVQRAWQRLRHWLSLRTPQPATVPAHRAEQLSLLFKAKDRAGGSITKSQEELEAPPIVTQPGAPLHPSAPPTPPVQPTPPLAAPPSAASTSSTLLAKKRARERQGEKK